MPQPRRKTSLRRAAGTVQEQFLGRIREVRDNPTVVLPACPDGEPKPIARLRRRLERLKEGKVGLLGRLDRGVFGAVREAIPIAQWTEAPILLDAKVAGSRRFYTQRGHSSRACSLGVQNHDQPRVLLLAYAEMAKKGKLHFFAETDDLVCTGEKPNPSPAWFEALGGEALDLREEKPGAWGCGHADRPRVELGLRGGPALCCCGPCGARVEGLHKRLRERYAGPQQRQPVEVHLLRSDGTRSVPAREALAKYRAGLLDENGLLRSL